MIEISPYPTLIQLKYYIDGVHHCATVFGKSIFGSNFPFALPLAKDSLGYCCINVNETKKMDGYKGVLKSIGFFTKDNNKSVLQKLIFITCV